MLQYASDAPVFLGFDGMPIADGRKGQHQAQALLGQMLFNGDRLPPQRARGLMWLTLARDSATADESWIKESYNQAIAKASEDDRAMALQMLKDWVQGKKN